MGWSQDKLAEKLGIGRTALSYLETGKFNPAWATAVKLSVVLDVSLDDLAADDLQMASTINNSP